jgi:hypothetical protein
MAARAPAEELSLVAASAAESLGFVALADVAQVLAAVDDRRGRLIGGHMVSLHCKRWSVADDLARATLDADVGIGPPLIAGLPAIAEHLTQLGYLRTAGSTFKRPVPELGPGSHAEIDLLIPAMRTRARTRKRVGDFETTEVPGLAEAQQRDGVALALRMKLLGGGTLTADLLLPDEADALVIKALAWGARRAGKDAVDMWRCLEVALAAEVEPRRFSRGDGKAARDELSTSFAGASSAGIEAIRAYRKLSREEATRVATRVAALRERVCGR